jgi:hypothetical protein
MEDSHSCEPTARHLHGAIRRRLTQPLIGRTTEDSEHSHADVDRLCVQVRSSVSAQLGSQSPRIRQQEGRFFALSAFSYPQ